MNSGFSRSLIGQIDWHIIYELVEALPLIYLFIYLFTIIIIIIIVIIIIIIIIFNITLIYFTWLSQPLKKKKKKKNSYFSVQNFKPLTDKVEMEQFKGAAINLSASKFSE